MSAGSPQAKLANSSKAVSQNDPSLLQALRLHAQAIPARLYELIRLCGQWGSCVSQRTPTFSSLFGVLLQRFQVAL